MRALLPATRRQWFVPALAGAVVATVILVAVKAGQGLVIVHPGIAAWLQAAGNAALVVAAAIAVWAAAIARSSFRSQRETARVEARLAGEDALRRQAADRFERHHRSIQLMLTFQSSWDSDKLMRWRSVLAEALLTVRTRTELSTNGRFALGEILNFMDIVGHCARQNLLWVEDAWEVFSYAWEIYWLESGSERDPDTQSISNLWENAAWLLAQFAKLEPDEHLEPRPEDEIRGFLEGERDLMSVERRILGAAAAPPWRRLMSRLWHGGA